MYSVAVLRCIVARSLLKLIIRVINIYIYLFANYLSIWD